MSIVKVKLKDVKVTEQMRRELEELERKPDSEIDFSDIPPLDENFFKQAKVGVFYRPIKHPVTMRLDADVLDWLRSKGTGYQTRANNILRAAMMADLKQAV